MSFALFDAALREPGRSLGFCGNVIDRLSEDRAEDCVETALADPAARLIIAGGGRMHLRVNGAGFLPYFSVAEAAGLSADMANVVLLGWDAGGPVLAAPSGLGDDALPEDIKSIDHRSVYTQGLIDEAALGALAQGAALLAWHRSHRFCGRCGAETKMRIGGYKRACPSCEAEQFPRTDPVAIMLAVTRERCLLGRSPHFPPGVYSALAGFIEPGETIEAAVRRETFEEAHIGLGRVVYHASQPWPFPYSLMIGCYGEALDEEVSFDGKELEDCRWFGRDEVHAILRGAHPDGITMPPKGAIAHHLIRDWATSEG